MTAAPDYLAVGDGDANVNRLYDNIQMVMPAVQLPVVQAELWNVVQEFCQLSSYFRAQVQWTMQPEQASLDFNPYSADMEVYQILKISGLPNYQVRGVSELINTGSATQALTGWAWLALKPTSFGNLPPVLFNIWFEAMLQGTKARLYSQPAKPYASPQMAEVCMRVYRSYIRRAKDQAERFNSDRQPPWTFPYFASGRRKN